MTIQNKSEAITNLVHLTLLEILKENHLGIQNAILQKQLLTKLNERLPKETTKVKNVRALQEIIQELRVKQCAIGLIDKVGYFIPTTEEERERGIRKIRNQGCSLMQAVNGYEKACFRWYVHINEQTELDFTFKKDRL